MINRRSFLKQMAVTGIATSMPSHLFSQTYTTQKNKLIWADLIHLSYNMWTDHTHVVWDGLPADTYAADDFKPVTCMDARRWARGYRPYLTFHEETWNAILKHMVEKGMNMVVIDLGDAIKYESHPEIAVENAWSRSKLKNELSKMRKMGLEPIPKLNFATTHHAWLGQYSRMVSTKKYYEVCKNLINEVIELFDTPRFFHLGMDEETYNYQRDYHYAVVRQNELWWHDFYLLMQEVEKNNVRSWIWSDYAWRDPDMFFKKMPVSVLQSNWYYGAGFDLNELNDATKLRVEMYNKLDAHGYDQVPTGSNHSNNQNFKGTVAYCKQAISSAHLKGFMTAPWRPTLAPCLDTHKAAIDQVAQAMQQM